MADGSVKIDITADDSDIKKKLGGVESEAESASGGLDKLGDSAENAGKDFGAADVAIGSFVGSALENLTSKIGETIGSIVALADETREYRDDMSKLDAAFSTAGHSTETASAAYDSFYKILGESDRTVEAVNHLAEFTKSEEELAQWSTIAAGVTAKFGDSLPIEGLTEAANETAKVGQVTGPLADALNWAGISEDEFNKKLEACNSEQERAALITSTLNSEYSAAAEEYNKLTANTQAARDATNNMEQAQANLGAAIEPVTTAWTNMKANALQWFVDTGLPALQKGWQWIKDNLPAIAILVGTLTTAWLTFGGAQKIVDGWNKVMAISQAALNAVMNANPIGLIIMAITALVAGFMILWNNCEGFRNFWIELWEGIKSAVSAAWEWITNIFSSAWDGIKNIWSGVTEFFGGIWDGIKGVFSAVGSWFSEKFTEAKDNSEKAWEKTKEFFGGVWDGIKNVFSNIGGWFSERFTEAKENSQNAWAKTKEFYGGVWDNVKSAFSSAGSWFSETFNNAKENTLSAFSNIKEKFGEIWGKIKEAFKTGDFLSIGKDLLTGLWNGINDKVDWLKSKVSGVVDKIKSWFTGKDGFDEHSPSKWSKQVAVDVNRGTALGFENSADIPLKAAQATTDKIKTAVSLENARMTQGIGTRDTGYTELLQAVGTQTAGINSLSSSFRSGTANKRPIIIQLNDRELGRAIVDVGGIEETRIGAHLAYGGAK